MADLATIELSEDGKTLKCRGAWDILHIDNLASSWRKSAAKLGAVCYLDVADLSVLDSTGALQLHQMILALTVGGRKPSLLNLSEQHASLFHLVTDSVLSEDKQAEASIKKHNIFYRLGENIVDKLSQSSQFLQFVGELNIALGQLFTHLRQFYWKGVLNALDSSGFKALPILALMSFLIGIVLAYQLGVQLEQYGANIFIVDVTGVAILREFAPLITAVIMAGRTSTSFAALIGTMKVNEELDALHTMGITPIQRLVIPRVIALVIILPLLIIWSDIFAVMGSMVMAKTQLDISYVAFLNRFSAEVSATQYGLGLVKGPFFAVIIAAIGCFQGFQVEMKAESVGIKTTHAAVQALFLIIIADAMFSILFSWLGV
jgi:phospholipid/cholesterol/gamma-HCH transport system permease protein